LIVPTYLALGSIYFFHLKKHMNMRRFKQALFAGAAILVTVAVFTLSTSGTSLQSLSADANTTPYCTPAQNDCKSSVTGNIYIGYKASSEWEEVEN
jgi:hypothetical protein